MEKARRTSSAQGSVRELARGLVNELVNYLGIQPTQPPKPMPLNWIASMLNVSIEYCPGGSLSHSDALLWREDRSVIQPSLFALPGSPSETTENFSAFKAVVYSKGVRRRFSVAHELGHCLLERWLNSNERFSLGKKRLEVVVDLLASYLLVPDRVLQAITGSATPFRIELSWLFSTARQLEISVSALIARLGNGSLDGVFRPSNCALAVGKKITDQEPRIVAVCTPAEWSVDTSKTLSQLGLNQLSRAFWFGAFFKPSRVKENIELKLRGKKGRIMSRQVCEYVVLPHQAGRIMFVVFDLPDVFVQRS